MNINELTIGQAKELVNFFNRERSESETKNPAIGKYCIVRCRLAGVHAGTVESMDGNIIVLKNSRRMWYWKSAFTLSECATSGIKNESKIACAVDTVVIPVLDVGEVIPCSVEAQNSIEGAKEYHA